MGASNQEKTLVGAFSMIVKPMDRYSTSNPPPPLQFTALPHTLTPPVLQSRRGGRGRAALQLRRAPRQLEPGRALERRRAVRRARILPGGLI